MGTRPKTALGAATAAKSMAETHGAGQCLCGVEESANSASGGCAKCADHAAYRAASLGKQACRRAESRCISLGTIREQLKLSVRLESQERI
mmetsp:Transcript_74302/g.131391  ORF Transcript_74302/g.131391 Transcript_74302/m.131391 type:complete len:91 (+) Transcript_74302:637-909(+)